MVEGSKDGNYFTPPGRVAAQSTAGTKSNMYQQASALNPGGYYRLKMQDRNGQYSYSPVVLVQVLNGGVSAAYNAVSKQIVIIYASGRSCYWQLINTSGAVVKKVHRQMRR